MKILDINLAQVKFEEREEQHYRECEELAEKLSSAIAVATADNTNTWGLLGTSTRKVIYAHVGGYLPETVATVTAAFNDAGYLCNPIKVDAQCGHEAINMLAIVWDSDYTNMADLYLTWLKETQSETAGSHNVYADADAGEGAEGPEDMDEGVAPGDDGLGTDGEADPGMTDQSAEDDTPRFEVPEWSPITSGERIPDNVTF